MYQTVCYIFSLIIRYSESNYLCSTILLSDQRLLLVIISQTAKCFEKHTDMMWAFQFSVQLFFFKAFTTYKEFSKILSQTCAGHHFKYLLFLPHLKKASLVNFTKNLQPKISQKIGSMGAELFHVGTEMDRQTDTTQQKVASWNCFAREPNNLGKVNNRFISPLGLELNVRCTSQMLGM